MYKTLNPPKLFPALGRFCDYGILCHVVEGLVELEYRHETIEEAADATVAAGRNVRDQNRPLESSIATVRNKDCRMPYVTLYRSQ